MSQKPGERFWHTEEVNGFKVSVAGEKDGQAIVIHPSGREFLMVGYRTVVTLQDPVLVWPSVMSLRVEKVRWVSNHWARDGEPAYWLNQAKRSVEVTLDAPQALRVSWSEDN